MSVHSAPAPWGAVSGAENVTENKTESLSMRRLLSNKGAKEHTYALSGDDAYYEGKIKQVRRLGSRKGGLVALTG